MAFAKRIMGAMAAMTAIAITVIAPPQGSAFGGYAVAQPLTAKEAEELHAQKVREWLAEQEAAKKATAPVVVAKPDDRIEEMAMAVAELRLPEILANFPPGAFGEEAIAQAKENLFKTAIEVLREMPPDKRREVAAGIDAKLENQETARIMAAQLKADGAVADHEQTIETMLENLPEKARRMIAERAKLKEAGYTFEQIDAMQPELKQFWAEAPLPVGGPTTPKAVETGMGGGAAENKLVVNKTLVVDKTLDSIDFLVDGPDLIGKTVTITDCKFAGASAHSGIMCSAPKGVGSFWIDSGTLERESLRRALRTCADYNKGAECSGSVTGLVSSGSGGRPELRDATIQWAK